MPNVPETEKTCSRCRETKPRTEFSHLTAARDGRNPACRACSNKRSERYRIPKRTSFSRPAILDPSDWTRAGEQWRPVIGWEGTHEVSDLGRVRVLPRPLTLARGGKRLFPGKILRGGHSGPYRNVLLCRKNACHTRLIHRLVMEAFLGPAPAGMCVNHINFDRNDNRLRNLEYVTYSENTRHSLRAGRMRSQKGERNPGSKLTEAQVLRIRALEGERPAREIGQRYGVGAAIIRAIWRRRAWGWLQDSC